MKMRLRLRLRLRMWMMTRLMRMRKRRERGNMLTWKSKQQKACRLITKPPALYCRGNNDGIPFEV